MAFVHRQADLLSPTKHGGLLVLVERRGHRCRTRARPQTHPTPRTARERCPGTDVHRSQAEHDPSKLHRER